MRLFLTILVGCAVVAVGNSDALMNEPWCNETSAFKTPAAGTCKGFWVCENGNIQFNTCSFLQVFDSEKLDCVWSILSNNGVSCGQQGVSDHDLWCSPGNVYKSSVNGVCSNYYYCNNGELTIESCPWPLEFNPIERECRLNTWPLNFECVQDSRLHTTPKPTTPSSNTISPGHDCTKGKTFVQSDPEDCSKYYRCKDGVFSPEQCGYGKQFDPSTLQCRFNYPWNKVNCGQAESTTKLPTTPALVTTQKPTSRPSDIPKSLICRSGNYFTTQSTKDCNEYYLCSNGKVTIVKCSILQKFDPMTHECKFNVPWIYRVNCTARPEKPVCKSSYYFNSPVPGSTKKYYNCSNGIMKEKECGILQAFDPKSQGCVYNIFGLNLAVKNALLKEKINGLGCNDGNSFNTSYPGDCHKYYVCANSSFLAFECPYGEKYNNTTGTCVLMSQCDLLTCYSKGPLCYPGVSYRIPVGSDCNEYSECNNGSWTKKSCPFMHRFDPATLECKFSIPEIYSVDCSAKAKCDNKPLNAQLEEKTFFESIKKQDLSLQSSGWPKCAIGQNFKAPFPYDCSRYIDCNNGSSKIVYCSMFHKFDPTSLECRFESPFNPVVCNIAQGKPKCNKGENFKAVFPYDCSKYYDCSNSNVTVKTCGYVQKFDPQTLECRYSVFGRGVNCNSLPGQPNCPLGKKFNSIYPEDCGKYYSCENGTVIEKQCPLWDKFDPATLQCRLSIPYLYSVNCSAVPGSGLKQSVKVKNLITIPKVDKKPVMAKITAKVADISDPTCEVGQRFKAVFSPDCKKYFNCVNGNETIEKCSWFKKFNPATLKCRWDLPFYRVNCSAVPGSALPVYPKKVKDNCKLDTTFNMVDKSDCKSYYACSNGELTYEKCGFLKKFDPVTLECSVDLPFHRVNCSALPGEPTCSEKGIIRKHYPGNCNQYFECNEGKLSVVKCGFMERFDQKKSECTFKWPFSSDVC